KGILGVHADLHAEAAAYIGGDDTNLALAEAQHLGHLAADLVRRLGAAVEDDPAADGVGRGGHGAALHGDAEEPLVDHALFHHAVGGGEGGLNVALLAAARVVDVAGEAVEEQGGA